jgi:hypothetical protein
VAQTPVSDFAGQRRADRTGLDAGSSISIGLALRRSSAGLDDHLAGDRMIDVLKRGAAKDTLASDADHLTGVDDRRHGEAFGRCRNRSA